LHRGFPDVISGFPGRGFIGRVEPGQSGKTQTKYKIMKIFLNVAAALFLSASGLTEETKAPPTMPSEVTLTSGRVLRKVSVVRWEKERVVLKHAAGADPIHFSIIKSIPREDLVAMRDGFIIEEARIATPTGRRIGGQVFITTRGAGAYKFAGAKVAAIPLSALTGLRSQAESDADIAEAKLSRFSTPNEVLYAQREQAKYYSWSKAVANITPIAQTTTDTEGAYELVITSTEPVFLFCATTRSAGLGEWNVWAVPVGSSNRVDLNGGNQL
jgi:hypothetical protein